MDEAPGSTAIDMTGHGHDATLHGGTRTTGRVGGGLDFASADSDYVSLPASTFSNLRDQVTVAMWVNGDTATQPAKNSLFHAVNAAYTRVININIPWGNSRVYWDAGNGGTTNYDRLSKIAMPENFEGQWNHWVFTKDAEEGMMKIYLNGELCHSGTGKTLDLEGVTEVRLGSAIDKQFYEGMIDEIRLYDVALDAAEIASLHEQSSPSMAWKRTMFTPAELSDPTVSDDSADPDQDSIPNLLEYAFGFDPKAFDPMPIGSLRREGDVSTWLVEFQHHASRNDVDLTLPSRDRSSHPGNWNSKLPVPARIHQTLIAQGRGIPPTKACGSQSFSSAADFPKPTRKARSDQRSSMAFRAAVISASTRGTCLRQENSGSNW